MRPKLGTAQHRAYMAGYEAAKAGKPKEHPYKRLVNAQTIFLSSWWLTGYSEGASK